MCQPRGNNKEIAAISVKPAIKYFSKAEAWETT